MAKALAAELSFVFEGTPSEPTVCRCEYVTEDGDLASGRKLFEDLSPDMNQTVTALCQAAVTTIKATEGI